TPPPPASTYPLSLHDALPIFPGLPGDAAGGRVDDGSAGASAGAAGPGLSAAGGDEPVGDGVGHVEEAAQFGGDLPDLVGGVVLRSEEHTSELQSRENLVCRLL